MHGYFHAFVFIIIIVIIIITIINHVDSAPLYSSFNVWLWPVFLAVNKLPSPYR